MKAKTNFINVSKNLGKRRLDSVLVEVGTRMLRLTAHSSLLKYPLYVLLFGAFNLLFRDRMDRI